MAGKVRVLRSNLNSIYANLAIEEAIIARNSTEPHLFLWRNEPAVTIGRHQNPWKECNLGVMDDHGVNLARRYSGGGAVYQDLGCTTFTFVNALSVDMVASRIIDSNFETLVDSLKNLGLNAQRKGRNDVQVGDCKVSGSAFKQVPGCLVHHGTILVDTDMTRLGQYLTPSKLKLQSKGISSVSARVVNLTQVNPQITHEHICESLTNTYRSHYNTIVDSSDPFIVDSSIQTDPNFRHHFSVLKDWNWRYGTTPEFSHHLETRIDQIGCFDIHYQVNHGKIYKVVIFSDCLYPDLIQQIQTKLTDTEYDPIVIRKTLLSTHSEDEILKSFTNWFVTEITP